MALYFTNNFWVLEFKYGLRNYCVDVNKAWKDTCRVLLGDEIGGLEDYRTYLSRYLEPVQKKKSCLSGKDVSVSSPHFCGTAKFIGNDEIREYNSVLARAPLDINDVKDVDSILEALKGNLYYSGNSITGNSGGVSDSDSCVNAYFVHSSSEISDSKYVAYSKAVRYAEYVFGSSIGGEGKFLIKSFELYNLARCMETLRVSDCSDCYYAASVEGCTNCMFSFNQRNKHYLIGNLALSRDKYARLKEKLVLDIRQSLESKKSVPSIVDILCGAYG